MFSTSHDVLNLILALCILVFTGFICYGLYYLVSGLRSLSRAVKRVEGVILKLEDLYNIAKSKLQQTNTYMTMACEIAKKIVEFAKERKEKREAEAENES
jgi:hypothetical protein